MITGPIEISSHVVNHFTNILYAVDSSQCASLIEEVVPTLVDSNFNSMLTMLPYKEEITKVFFNLNKTNVHGPDDFGGGFSQTYWNII